jgi:hypothetical protein
VKIKVRRYRGVSNRDWLNENTKVSITPSVIVKAEYAIYWIGFETFVERFKPCSTVSWLLGNSSRLTSFSTGTGCVTGRDVNPLTKTPEISQNARDLAKHPTALDETFLITLIVNLVRLALTREICFGTRSLPVPCFLNPSFFEDLHHKIAGKLIVQLSSDTSTHSERNRNLCC